VTHVIFCLIVQSMFNVRHSKALNSSFKQFVRVFVCGLFLVSYGTMIPRNIGGPCWCLA